MRVSVALLALLAVAASRGQCGGPSPDAGYDPCAGKACGDSCSECAPDDAGCVETAVVKACDRLGRCLAAVSGLCMAVEACAGKVCGQECVVEPPCRAASPPCLAPSIQGRCDEAGLCVAGGTVACQPVADCAGQPCGVPCDPCGGMCMHPYASACDLWGRCVPASSWICWDPCAGKACGADCHLCPADALDCAETLELKACDPSGRCVSRTAGLVCPP